MTPEQQLEEFRKKKQLAQFRAMKSAKVEKEPTAPQSPDEEMSTADSIAGGAQSFMQGLIPFADEAIGKVRSGLDKLVTTDVEEQAAALEGAPVADQGGSEMYRQDSLDRQAAFEKANPKTALALEVGGGVASPLNYIAPGLGMSSKANALQKALALSGRGAAEGAAYGAGAAEQGDRMSGATSGAAWGAALPAALQGAGRVSAVPFKENVKTQLGKGKDFIPLPLAAGADSTLGQAYRNIVGRLPGASGMLRRQEQPFVDAMDRGVRLAEEKAGKLARGQKLSKLEMKAKRNMTDKAIKKAADKAAAEEAVIAATPRSMGKNKAREIAESTPFEAERKLSKWFEKNGFRDVKGRNFEWDGKLGRDLKEISENDPDFALTLGNAASKVDGLVGRLLKEGKKQSDLVPQDYLDELSKMEIAAIDGDALMALRNAFTIPANKGGPSNRGKKLRQVANKFDDMIKDQLTKEGPEGKKAWKNYQSELESWGAKQALSREARRAKNALEVNPSLKGLGRNAPRKLQKTLTQIKEGRDAGLDMTKAKTEDIGDIMGQYDASKAAAKDLKKVRKGRSELNELLVPKNTSPGSTYATVAALGLAGLAGGPAGLAAPLLLTAGGGTQGFQRALAGQSGIQKFAQSLAEKEYLQELIRNLRNTSGRYAASQQGVN